jgi:hypothetical protein
MTASFVTSAKPFLAALIKDSLSSIRPVSRKASTAYTQGTHVTNGGKLYVASVAGTTGTGAGPTAVTGTSVDGTVTWLALGTYSTTDFTNNLYLGVGKTTAWSNEGSPPSPSLDPLSQKTVKGDLLYLLQLSANDIRLGMIKNVWTTGTIYSQYDPSVDQTSYPTPNYVVVGGSFVYKCLDNNNGATSTVQPSGTSASIAELADGYVWLYIGTIASQDSTRFTTTNFYPLPALSGLAQAGSISTFSNVVTSAATFTTSDTIVTSVVGDGSGAQAAVRTNTVSTAVTVTDMFAAALGTNYSDAYGIAYKSGATGTGALVTVNITSGAISSYTVDVGGSGYANTNGAIVLLIGDGTGGAAGAVTVSGGVVTGVANMTGGTGYTWAKAFVIPGTKGALARAVLAPLGGHGSNLIEELGAGQVLLSKTLATSLGAYVPVVSPNNDFRQLSLISNVLPFTGSTSNAAIYIGPAHPSYSSPGSLNKYSSGSGNVLYINNIVSVVHTSAQEEILKISFTL